MAPTEDQDTCERLSGFYFARGATWAPLRAEALVNALAVFTSFGAQHGPLENREKSHKLGNRAALSKSLMRWAECICSMGEY